MHLPRIRRMTLAFAKEIAFASFDPETATALDTFAEKEGWTHTRDHYSSDLGGSMSSDYKTNVSSKYAGRYGSWQVGVYNGGGYHAAEQNTNKVVEARLTIRPAPDGVPGLQFTVFGLAGKGNKAATGTSAPPDWKSGVGMISYESKYLTFSGQGYLGIGNQGGSALESNGTSAHQSGFSVFASVHLPIPRYGQKVSLLGRFDEFNPNTRIYADLQRFPWNCKELVSQAKKAAERKHGIGDATFFQMAHRPPADVGLGEFAHFYGRLHPGDDALVFEDVLERQGVQDGGQHAHIIRARAFHALGGPGKPPEDVAAADDDCDLHPETGDLLHLGRDRVENGVINAVSLLAHESLTGELKENSLVSGTGHNYKNEWAKG